MTPEDQSLVNAASAVGLLQAVIAGDAADQFVALPAVQDAADILAGDAGHCGEVGLRHLLPHQHASGTGWVRQLLAERIGQGEQRPRDAALQRQEAGRDK